MAMSRRVNVASGRQLEQLAHYSRALRVGDTVLQSGTTAIDRQGNVRGEGDVARAGRRHHAHRRVEHGQGGRAARRRGAQPHLRHRHRRGRCRRRARWPATSGGAAGGHARAGQPAGAADPARRDRARRRRRRRARPRGASPPGGRSRHGTPTRAPSASATACSSRAPRRSMPGARSKGRATCTGRRAPTMETIFRALAEAGGVPGRRRLHQDLPHRSRQGRRLHARVARGARRRAPRPRRCSGSPALVRPELLVEIEAEAVLGAARTRRDIYTEHMREKPRGYARAVEVGDRVYVSGCTSLSSTGRGAGGRRLGGASTTSLSRPSAGRSARPAPRSTTWCGGARSPWTAREQNRPYGQGPAWFAKSRPTSLGCRIAVSRGPSCWWRSR